MNKIVRVSLLCSFFLLVFMVLPVGAAPDIVFSDDFSGDLSQWTIVSGTWAIENNEYHQDSSLPTVVSYATDITVTSASLSSSVVIRTDNSRRAAGFVMRYQDADNYYNIALYTENDAIFPNRIIVWRHAGGTWLMLKEISIVILDDTWYSLKVELDDFNFKIYLNNNLKGTVTDTYETFSSGKVGLIAHYTHAHFDNVLVENPVPESNPDPIPEFGTGLPIITSVAAAVYMLIQRRLGKRKE